MTTKRRQWIPWVALAMACAAAHAEAASLVGTTTAADAFSSASRFFTHCANGYCWVAFHNGTTPVIYSSPEGATWTSQGNIFSAVNPASAGQWAARFSGTNVIAFGTNPVNPRLRWYRNGTLNSNGTVTWNAADNQADSAAFQLEVNSLIANNKPILYYVDPTSWGTEVLGSQLNGPAWTTPAPTPPSIAGASGGGFSAAAMFPTGGADPNDFILLRATTTTPYTPGRHRLLADRFDASVPVYVSNLQWYDVSRNGLPPGGPFQYAENMDTEVKEGTDAQAHVRFAAVRDTSGNLHAVYVNRNDNVVHYKKDVGFNDTWSRLFIDVTASAAAIDRVALGAAGNYLFLFYSKSDNGIYYRRFDGTNWGTETTLKAASATLLRGALAPMERASGCSLGIAWVEGAASPFNVMYSSVGSCSTLVTSTPGSTVTVDTAEVKMVWDAAAAGGGLSEFYGKTEANPGVSRRGNGVYNVFSTQLNDGSWHFEGGGVGTAQLVEVTATRVRIRQSYNYTGQLHLDRYWSIYALPRLALNENIILDAATGLRGAQGLHPKGEAACGGPNTFYCAGQSIEASGIWLATDDGPGYSDMLAITDTTPFFGRAGTGYAWNNMLELGPPNTWLARVHEPGAIATAAGTYNRRYLVYPYLAGLTSGGTEWQPYANDYRTPDVLTFNFFGTGWEDANENTSAGDFYNDAEAAYAVDIHPTAGMSVNINGNVTPHPKPFFKIRQWRSLADPPSVTRDLVPLVNGVDYQADVKPISRAYFCTDATCSTSPVTLANGGLVGHANEFLADAAPAKNATLDFSVATNYVYFGSDVKFRGLNIALATPGQGTATLRWEYWGGGVWTNLAGVTGFTDQTNNLKTRGTIYWGSDSPETDPPGWTAISIQGSPQLFFVRARLNTGSYTTQPVEGLIKTDILLFQYCGDVTAFDETFVFSAPVPTAVTLASFSAASNEAAVDLSWETASELQNLGFHLYRADSTDGPYARITSSLIPGLGSSATGRSYSYRDDGLQNGRTYFYKLEDVETTGRTELHGPVSATPSASATGGGGTPPSDSGSPSGTAYGEPSSVLLREVERSPRHVVLELLTGGLVATPAEDGQVRLTIPGFESVSRPGEPELPMRRALVEAVAGRKVHLASVLSFDVVHFQGLRPSVQGAPGIEVDENGSVLPSEEKRREGRAFRGMFPTESALLLGASFQGETKKAEVHLFPLRWDGRGLVLSRRLLVRLEFTGTEEKETSRGGSRGRRAVKRGSHARSGVVAQLVVKERGLYRVGYEELFPTPAGRRSRGISATSLRLSRQGESVAFHVEPAGTFGPGSSLYFLSEGSSLNPYADAVYELETSGRGVQMEVEALGTVSGVTGEYFQRIEREENKYYQSGLLDAPDLWLWDIVISPGTKSFTFTVDQLSLSPSGGRVSVELQGASDFEGIVDHHVKLRVNGSAVGEASWDGKLPQTVVAEVPAGVLREGENTLEIEDVGDTGVSYSMVFLNRFSVSYPRLLVATGGKLEGRFEASGMAVVAGGSASGVLLDTTGIPRWLQGMQDTASAVHFPVLAGKSYLLASNLLYPEVRLPEPSTLKDATNQADYLLLAPKAFLEAAQPLLELRQSQGLTTKAVSLEEVFAQFGHGETSPEAIKEFLEYAYQFWADPSPRYVLLLGDASYDPKNYLKTGVKDWLPGFPVKTSFLWTVSDPTYAAVNGEDLLPDLALGRLSAGSVEEAQRLIQKVLAFENGGGNFDGTAVLVADNADLAGNFEADANEIASTLLASRNPKRIYYSQEGANTRTRIKEAFDQGASLMSYMGHGGTVIWASENIFNFQDVAKLAPQPQQPLVLTLNCLNGFFHFPPLNSMSEALVKAEGKGAIAAFSPSGLSVNDAAHLFHKALLQEILSGRHERLGDAVLAAQKAYADSGAFPELLSIYNLFGDPALPLQ